LFKFLACGNAVSTVSKDFIWDAVNVRKARVVDLGGKAIVGSGRELETTVRDYAEFSARGQEAQINKAQIRPLGDAKEHVVGRLFRMRVVTRKNAEAVHEFPDRRGQ